ncbi:hypothetical protein HA402_010857, partial [Bradysia odoriphaga]
MVSNRELSALEDSQNQELVLPTRRKGLIYLLKYDGNTEELSKLDSVETTAILDQKWTEDDRQRQLLWWNNHIVYSGGDDTSLHVYDRGISTKTMTNKSHMAGVTSLLSLENREHILAIGSHDENLRIFDLRTFKNPLSSIDLKGGIWRIKPDPVLKDLLLYACMYHNFSFVNIDDTIDATIDLHRIHSNISMQFIISARHFIYANSNISGAIFTEDQKDSSTELAFKYGVYRINKDKNILPKTTLIYDISYVPRDDSFRATKKVCRQMELGVHAIFGPSDSHLGSHIQSICKALDVPHIETRFDFDHEQRDFSINLHPSQEHINNAYRDLIIFLNWTKVAIIYEEDYASGLFKQHELMKSSSTTELYIRQATPETYRQVLKEIRQKEIFKIIVDTNPHYINRFLRAILQLQMNDYRYHFMFTTFDIETFDLEDFKYNSVNITAFRLVDIGSRRVTEVLEQIQKFNHNGHNILNNYTIVQTEPALMFDAVYVFAAGLTALDRSSTLKSVNLSCELEQPWHDGLSLYNYLTSTRILGLTGPIEFYEGERSNFKMDLLKLKREEIQKVGYWSPIDGISITDPTTFYESNTTNITLIVITREEKPYVMVKENTNLTGNARYEGFCVDLLKGIANQIGFQYSIKLVPDHMYGVYDPNTKTWNGIVRELMERRADLAVASMTINYARESVIDFTKPFMNLGIGILFKVPTSQPTRLFSFLNPLAVEIWLYVLAAYLLVSFTLFVMARFSPYEWNNPLPMHPDSDILENQFSVSNSFWFITGTFLRQGSGLNPK